jgi:hypothetical protein
MYRALSAWREGRRIEILVYFNQAAHTPTVDSLQQLQEVLAFQRNLQNLGFFVGSYDGPADFEAKIRQSLTQVVRRWPARPATATGAPPKSPLASPASRAIEHWHEELVTDRLDTVLDPRRGREFYTLAAVVRQALVEDVPEDVGGRVGGHLIQFDWVADLRVRDLRRLLRSLAVVAGAGS